MTHSLVLNHPLARTTESFLRFLQTGLMMLGAFFVLASAYVFIGEPDLARLLSVSAPSEIVTADETEIATIQSTSTPAKITAQMQAALDYSAKRYRVSPQALTPVFQAAQQNAIALGLDPLLIVSVIAVESSFNPLSQSNMGAQGLMQVIPRFHKEKLPADAGELPLFNPVVNVAVGSKVLQEYIRRKGSVVAGLQQFNGASNDPAQAYANKVLAVKERLESAPRRPISTNA